MEGSTYYNGGTVQNPSGVSLPEEDELLEFHIPGNLNNFLGLDESFKDPLQQEALLGSQGIGTPPNPNADWLPGFHSLSLGEPYIPLRRNGVHFSQIPESSPSRQEFQLSADNLELGFGRLTLSSSRTNPGLANRFDLTCQNFRGNNLSLRFDKLVPQGAAYTRNGYESGESNNSSNSSYQRSRTEYSRSYSSSPDPYLVSMNQEASFLSKNRFGHHRQMRVQPNLRLSHLRGKIAFYATKENYAATWTYAMNKASHEEIDMVFSEIVEADICELCKKISGSVLIKHLIEKCSVDQRTQILYLMTRNTRSFFNICINPNGADVAMKLWMWLFSDSEKRTFLSAVSSIFMALPRNQDGLTFMMWSLRNFPLEHTRTLLFKLADTSVDIAKDKNGCWVLKDLISQLPLKMADVLVMNIIANAVDLSFDSFGNYVVQHVLETRDGFFRGKILNVLRGNYVALSFDKCGSHVVQKCLEETSREQSFQIIEEIRRNVYVSLLITDRYGNYVFQSALRKAKKENHYQYTSLKEKIQEKYLEIHGDYYGRQVISFYERLKKSG